MEQAAAHPSPDESIDSLKCEAGGGRAFFLLIKVFEMFDR